MTDSKPPYRVIQWATGTVGIHAVPAIAAHPDLELTGLWVHSDSKAGRDAGEICGGPALGVIATNDADALLDSGPDAAGEGWFMRRARERGSFGPILSMTNTLPVALCGRNIASDPCLTKTKNAHPPYRAESPTCLATPSSAACWTR